MNSELLRVHDNAEAEILRLQRELFHEMALNARAECTQIALSKMLHCGNNWPSIVEAVRDLVMEHAT
jgi:hypothetical protein